MRILRIYSQTVTHTWTRSPGEWWWRRWWWWCDVSTAPRRRAVENRWIGRGGGIDSTGAAVRANTATVAWTTRACVGRRRRRLWRRLPTRQPAARSSNNPLAIPNIRLPHNQTHTYTYTRYYYYYYYYVRTPPPRWCDGDAGANAHREKTTGDTITACVCVCVWGGEGVYRATV